MAQNFAQIVYNLEDYGGSGGLMSTKKFSDANQRIASVVYSDIPAPIKNYDNLNGQITEVVNSYEKYEAERIDIFDSNVLEPYSGTLIKKIGIQGPPGTKFIIGDSNTQDSGDHTIMIGRTGVYELNDDIIIKKLQFVRPITYRIDETASKSLTTTGLAQMTEARDEFLANVEGIAYEGNVPPYSETNSEYWDQYQQYHKQYVAKYRNGLALYLKGKAGIYTEDGSSNDLYNIIIDFTYEGVSVG